jgi:hypothetical protein
MPKIWVEAAWKTDERRWRNAADGWLVGAPELFSVDEDAGDVADTYPFCALGMEAV